MGNKKVLVVIDAQEDFVRGPLGSPEAREALKVLQKVVNSVYDKENCSIFYAMDTHNEIDYEKTQEGFYLKTKHCIRGTPGWELCPEATLNGTALKKAYTIEKSSFGCMELARQPWIKEADKIILCGFCTDICVMGSFQILKAAFPEKEIYVMVNACAGSTPEKHLAALSVMDSCQGILVRLQEGKTEK